MSAKRAEQHLARYIDYITIYSPYLLLQSWKSFRKKTKLERAPNRRVEWACALPDQTDIATR